MVDKKLLRPLYDGLKRNHVYFGGGSDQALVVEKIKSAKEAPWLK